nr:hypothetical protein [Tanacetum cinerariifolium]
KHSHRRQVPPSAGPGSPLSIVYDNEDSNERVVITRCKVISDASRSQSQTWSIFHGTAKASLANNHTANWRRLTYLGSHTQYPSWNKLTG